MAIQSKCFKYKYKHKHKHKHKHKYKYTRNMKLFYFFWSKAKITMFIYHFTLHEPDFQVLTNFYFHQLWFQFWQNPQSCRGGGGWVIKRNVAQFSWSLHSLEHLPASNWFVYFFKLGNNIAWHFEIVTSDIVITVDFTSFTSNTSASSDQLSSIFSERISKSAKTSFCHKICKNSDLKRSFYVHFCCKKASWTIQNLQHKFL